MPTTIARNMQEDDPAGRLELTLPQPADGAAIESLVRSCGTLDNNSIYAYLLLCTHFARTCVLARRDGRLAGFLSAYLKPGNEDTLFVWQVAVAQEARRRGVAAAMLRHLLGRRELRLVRFLEATVGLANHASRKLFTGLAEDTGTRCEIRIEFDRGMFDGSAHEEEYLFRIGPFNQLENAYEPDPRHLQPHGIEREVLHPFLPGRVFPGARRPDLG